MLKRKAKKTTNSEEARPANLLEITEQPAYVSSKASTENKRSTKSIEHEVCWSAKGAPERTITPFQYRLDLPLHWKIQQSRLKYLANRL